MQTNERNHRKYVFVCGLQRSGTSVLGRNIARLEDCTGFKNTGVLMDEGQFVQDVYPIDAQFGGAGRFGFDPRAHRTENSDLLTPENIAKLRASWHAYWDENKRICVEKTPANLLMTRFLQAAFPDSYFVVIRRHPVPVSMASQRWKISVSPLYRLFEHWLHCHELFEEDKKHLKRVYELRYEDYIENPDKYHREIAAFIGTRVSESPKEDQFRTVAQLDNPTGLRVPEHAMEATSGAHNEKYFKRWCYLLERSVFRYYYRYLANKYEPRFVKYGYSLRKGLGVGEQAFNRGARISAFLGPAYCVGASISALLWRFAVWSRWYVKQKIKALLPKFVLNKIREARNKAAPSKDQSATFVHTGGSTASEGS
jgi:hypothetical protein